MQKPRALWSGDLPLAEAFWTWAVIVGLLVNLSTSTLFLVLIMAGQPWPALIVGYAFSVPYNVAVTVGVWRAAGRYDGPRLHADLARAATVILMAVLSVT